MAKKWGFSKESDDGGLEIPVAWDGGSFGFFRGRSARIFGMAICMGKNVLLVEDDRVSREALSGLLASFGHEVRAVWSAEEAKRTLAEFKPDVAAAGCEVAGFAGGCVCGLSAA